MAFCNAAKFARRKSDREDPMKKISVLVSTGNLGDNIIEHGSFYEGTRRNVDCFAADAGTADAGPTFLGADKPHNPEEWEEHDLELLLVESRKKNAPLIIGSCSTTGTDEAVMRYARMIRSIAKRHRLPNFRMASIYSQIDKNELSGRIDRGEVERLGAPYDLTQSILERTSNVTASMGVEQIVHAFQQGAQVVLAGRACDDAVIAAYPVHCGFSKGISLHAGKSAECASLVCWPQMVKESVVATIYDDSFTIEPMHPDQCATPHSVAAHSMYERVDSFIQAVPGGVLDLHNAMFEAETERITRVRNSVFLPSADGSYKVKLEGAGELGYRAYCLVGIRDNNAIGHIDSIVDDTRKKVAQIVGASKFNQYMLFFHVYGRNAVMKSLEPVCDIAAHEIAVVIEAVSADEQLATAVVKCAKFRMFYMSYPGQKNSSGGSVALLTDEPLYPRNKCYTWTVDHLLKLECPLDDKIFRYEYEDVVA